MIGPSQLNEDKERRYIKLQSKGYKHQRYEFRSYELALAVREVVFMKIVSFDANGDQKFQQSEIRQFLVNVLHQNQNEIHYVVRNVFRYDYNSDGIIEYDELVNFCMEQHFGEIAIQRLHKRKLYQRGAQRIMSEMEFYQTIRFALAFVEFVPSESDLKMVFEAVDVDKDGYISYEDYFRFLKEYFGSKSFAAGLVHKLSVMQQLHSSPRGKKGETNLLKKYSKYEGKGTSNLPAVSKPSINITINSVANKAISNANATPVVNFNPINPVLNDSDKKAKVVNNSKIELTILKNQREKTQITLNQQQQSFASKIARLVYSQLKLALMFYDSNQVCFLSADGILLFFRNTLKYTEPAQVQIAKRCNLTKDRSFTYSQASKVVILQHIYRVFRSPEYQDGQRLLSLSQFCQICESVCSIVKNTSIVPKFDALYQLRCEKIGSISLADTQNLLNYIFNFFCPKQ